jgi:ABC-type polysaccharide/polyol phosphate export permease
VYPLELMPARFHWLLYLWPPTPVIQCSRSVLIAGVTPSTFVHAALVLEAFAVLALGIVVFRRYAPRAAEYL